jgi:hypothetical protein
VSRQLFFGATEKTSPLSHAEDVYSDDRLLAADFLN